MAILTAAQFKAHFPQLVGTTEDTIIDGIIAEVDDLIASYIGFPETDAGGHTMMSSTYTLYLDRPAPQEQRALCVCLHPIVTITSVNIDADWAYGAATLLVAGTDYTHDSQHGLVLILPDSTYTWPTAYRATKVVLVAGYTTAPAGLRAIAAAATRHLWNLRQVQGQSAMGFAGDSVTLTDTEVLLPAAVKDALQAYLTPCAAARVPA